MGGGWRKGQVWGLGGARASEGRGLGADVGGGPVSVALPVSVFPEKKQILL